MSSKVVPFKTRARRLIREAMNRSKTTGQVLSEIFGVEKETGYRLSAGTPAYPFFKTPGKTVTIRILSAERVCRIITDPKNMTMCGGYFLRVSDLRTHIQKCHLFADKEDRLEHLEGVEVFPSRMGRMVVDDLKNAVQELIDYSEEFLPQHFQETPTRKPRERRIKGEPRDDNEISSPAKALKASKPKRIKKEEGGEMQYQFIIEPSSSGEVFRIEDDAQRASEVELLLSLNPAATKEYITLPAKAVYEKPRINLNDKLRVLCRIKNEELKNLGETERYVNVGKDRLIAFLGSNGIEGSDAYNKFIFLAMREFPLITKSMESRKSLLNRIEQKNGMLILHKPAVPHSQSLEGRSTWASAPSTTPFRAPLTPQSMRIYNTYPSSMVSNYSIPQAPVSEVRTTQVSVPPQYSHQYSRPQRAVAAPNYPRAPGTSDTSSSFRAAEYEYPRYYGHGAPGTVDYYANDHTMQYNVGRVYGSMDYVGAHGPGLHQHYQQPAYGSRQSYLQYHHN